MKQFFWKACVAVLLTTGLLRADGPGPILTSDPSVAAETNSYHAPSTWFGGAEFLLWNIRDPELPNLASSLPVGLASVNTSVTATNGANQQANLGATTVFVPVSISSDPTFPNNRVNLGDHNGLRGNIGFWFTPEGPWGIEGTFFALEERERNFRLTTGNSVNQFVLNTGLNTTTVVVTGGGVAGGQTTINQPAVFPATSVANLTARIQAEALGGMIDLLARHVPIGPVLFTGRSGFRSTHFE